MLLHSIDKEVDELAKPPDSDADQRDLGALAVCAVGQDVLYVVECRKHGCPFCKWEESSFREQFMTRPKKTSVFDHPRTVLVGCWRRFVFASEIDVAAEHVIIDIFPELARQA
jgi:hypothetical protein